MEKKEMSEYKIQVKNLHKAFGKKVVLDGVDERFVRVTFYGVYMDEGEALIQINQGSDNFEIDYIEINNNDNIYENDFEIQTEPVAPEASSQLQRIR